MCHPDVNKTVEAKNRYLEITEAYETLIDPKRREIYDMYGMSTQQQDNAEINYDIYGPITNILRAAFRGGNNSATTTSAALDPQKREKTYEEILNEYEQFFNLSEEMQ